MIKQHLGLVAGLLSMCVTGTVHGAGAPSALDGIKDDITDLQTSVNNIIAPGQSNVRFSPPVLLSYPQFLSCRVANVSNVNQTVQVDQLNHDGSVAISVTLDLLPGQATGTGDIGTQGLTASRWCRFIVLNGSRTAIRAAITLEENVAAPLISLPAE